MASLDQPILFCHDGSDDSRRALRSASNLLASGRAVVLAVWQPLTAQLMAVGSFGVYALSDEAEADEGEEAAARTTAEDGARLAREAGYDATARVEESKFAVWRTIVDVADELDAGLIVCGTRGRGAARTALLGSVSHAVLSHAGRPVLISPDPRQVS